jgi:Asp-tRNA(Asn)/Glu-tRNA(Gln) amidotransferase A subunit family amidase
MSTRASGQPIGVHFSARPGDERTLLELAYEIEQASPWPRIDRIGVSGRMVDPCRRRKPSQR